MSRALPQRGQQAGLRIAGVCQLDVVTEYAAGTQELRLRGEDVDARIYRTGRSFVSCLVATATSQPWMSTSTKR